jgi:hypothetical protein
MLSWLEFPPPADSPLPSSGELLPFCCGLCAPPPLGPPVLGIGIPTVGKPPGRVTPPETVGPLWPPL